MIKQLLNSHWDFMRWLRLIFALTFIIMGIVQHDNLTGLFGAFFLYQAVFNVSCCGSNDCSMPDAKEKKVAIINFEEIKTK